MHTVSRMCITCHKRQPPDQMIRLVRAKNQVVFVSSVNSSADGRSAYICKNAVCIQKALDRKGKDAVSYALKVSPTPDVKKALLDFAHTLHGSAASQSDTTESRPA